MKNLFAITFSILLLTACKSHSDASNDFNKQEVKDSIKTTLDKYFADVKQNGLKAELKYLDNTEDFFWVPPGSNTSINYDSVKTHIEKFADVYKLIDNKWETLTIKPLTRDLASYTGVISSVMIDTSDKKTEFKLIETGTIIKRKTGWKLYYGQTTLTN